MLLPAFHPHRHREPANPGGDCRDAQLRRRVPSLHLFALVANVSKAVDSSCKCCDCCGRVQVPANLPGKPGHLLLHLGVQKLCRAPGGDALGNEGTGVCVFSRMGRSLGAPLWFGGPRAHRAPGAGWHEPVPCLQGTLGLGWDKQKPTKRLPVAQKTQAARVMTRYAVCKLSIRRLAKTALVPGDDAAAVA